MENLPIEIQENILLRLPLTAETLQATKVWKNFFLVWQNLFPNRCFNDEGFLFAYHLSGKDDVQLYYGEQYDSIYGDVDHRTKMMSHYYGRFNKKSKSKSKSADVVVGSCNGLVCLRKVDQHGKIRYLVCNPLTGEYIFVPEFDYTGLKDIDRNSWSRYQTPSDGFGYCHSTNEYKIVIIHCSKPDVHNVLVYTIGSCEWRNIGIMPHSLSLSRGIFSIGVLHWLTADKQEPTVIIGFDLKDETFLSIPMPPCNLYCFDKHCRIKLLGGNLCFVRTSYDGRTEIWAFKRKNIKEHAQTQGYYDNRSLNWIQKFSIEPLNGCPFEPFAVTRRKQVLVWHTHNILYGYDRNASSVDKLWDNIMLNGINGMRCSWVETIPHKNSFVSLKDLGESGAKRCSFEWINV